MNRKIFLSTILMIFLSCAIKTHYIQDGAKHYPPTKPQNVKLYSGDIINRQYEVIGCVAIDVPGNGDDAAIYLKEEAASIGADAVIFVKLAKISSYGSRTGLSGTAIKFIE